MGLCLGGAPEMLGFADTEWKSKKNTLISGTHCVMPHQQYLSARCPGIDKKTSTYSNQLYEKRCVSPQMIHSELHEDLNANLLHGSLLIAHVKYTFSLAARGSPIFEILEKRYTAVNFFKWYLSAKLIIFDNYIWKFNHKLPLIKTYVPKSSHRCWESLLKLSLCTFFKLKTFKDKVIEKNSMNFKKWICI